MWGFGARNSVECKRIRDAAAEAIGARGLLVRVGAYFHDIGKAIARDDRRDRFSRGIGHIAGKGGRAERRTADASNGELGDGPATRPGEVLD